MVKRKLILVFITISLFNACNDDSVIEILEKDIETPDWTEATHGNNVEPDYSAVFFQDKVIRIDIKIDEDEWNTMEEDLESLMSSAGRMNELSEDPIWVPCSIYYNGIEWYKVGIRFKGNSSLMSTYRMGLKKFSFKLDFDQFEDTYPSIKNQRFYGFKQLNLKNNYEDKSYMREKVASDLFIDFGITSPQTAFCAVYVDYGSGSQYFGVYTLVEEVDDSVLEDQFENEDGNLYKPDGDAASFADGKYNSDEMEKKNNEDLADFSDVYSLYTILNSTIRESDVEQWCSELEQNFNVDIFLRWLAANTAMQNWDTYGKMTHNYYLYNNPENNLLTWIPWDNNEALEEGKQGGAISLELDEVDEGWPLIRYLIDIPEYKKKYQEYLQLFIGEVFVSEAMEALYTQYYNLLKNDVYNEVLGYSFLSSNEEFDQAVDELKHHVEERTDEVLNYID